MPASVEGEFEQLWAQELPRSSAEWDELPTDNSYGWLGLLLMLGSAIFTIRALCWVAATIIRTMH